MFGILLFSFSVWAARPRTKKIVRTPPDFVQDRKKAFIAAFDHPEANANIHASCEEEERKWTRRTMIDATPQGNVVMHYDLYKHVFVYFSDQTISYRILNASAMKYVRIFRCRDFFRDSADIPTLSPFTLLDIEEEQKEKQSKKVLQGPFIKPKKSSAQRVVPTEAISYRNKFQYQGKVRNWKVLPVQVPPTVPISSYAQFKRMKLSIA